jgi:hypothetical protein
MPKSLAQIRTLIDEGIRLEAQIDPLNNRLKIVKNEIKVIAEETQTHKLQGLLGTATVSDDKDIIIERDKLLAYLKKHKQTDLLPKLTKVLVDAVRKELGESAIKAIGTEIPKPYNKCKLKSAPGLDLSEVANLDLTNVAKVMEVVEAAKSRAELIPAKTRKKEKNQTVSQAYS